MASAANESAQKALRDTILMAPFGGVIAQIPIAKQQRVQSGERIATLINIDSMEVSFNLPSRVIATVQNTRNYVLLDAFPELRIEAIFKKADLLADATSQTYNIVLSFKPPEGLLILPGMSATVEIEVPALTSQQLDQRIPVPLSAIVAIGAQRYVWVVERATNQVEQRLVEVEDGIGEFLYVTSGLSVDETIVTAGAHYLSEGMRVRRWEE